MRSRQVIAYARFVFKQSQSVLTDSAQNYLQSLAQGWQPRDLSRGPLSWHLLSSIASQPLRFSLVRDCPGQTTLDPQTLRNQIALDFRSSGVQSTAESIAQIPLDALVHHVAIATVNL
jgi:hypothetical protein